MDVDRREPNVTGRVINEEVSSKIRDHDGGGSNPLTSLQKGVYVGEGDGENVGEWSRDP